MSATQPSENQRQAFARFVAGCNFFNNKGFMDLEKFCLHLNLSLFCDEVAAPDPIALYELMLEQVGKLKTKSTLSKIYREEVSEWSENLRSYYPDKQRTWMNVELLADVYTLWIQRVGTELLHYPNPNNAPGRYWVKADWSLSSQYLGRFEAELVRTAGLSKFIGGSVTH